MPEPELGSASTSLGDLDKELQSQHPTIPSRVGHIEADAIESIVPPNGGLQAWLQVLGAFFLLFASWGFVNSFGAYQNYYYTELLLGTSASSISWIGSLQAFLLLSVGVLAGPFYDKGYFRQLIGIGIFFSVFGIMMTSIASKFWQILLAQGLCVGLGSGCLFVPSVTVVVGYFSTRRSFATGVATTGGSFGGIVYSVIFRSLVDKIGFGWATRILGFLTLGLLSISFVLMKPLQLPAGPRSLLLPKAFKEPAYTIAAVALGMMFLGIYIPYFQVQGYAAELYRLDKTVSYQLLTIMNLTSVLGRTIPPLAADKWGPINVMWSAGFATAVLGYSWIAMKSIPALVVFAVIYGFFSGAVVALPPVTFASLGGKENEMGTRIGMAFGFGAIGLLAGNPIAGAFIDIPKGKFVGAQIFCGTLVLVGSALFLIAKISKDQCDKKEKQETDGTETAARNDGERER